MLDRLKVGRRAFGKVNAFADEVRRRQDDLDRWPALPDRRRDLYALAAARHVKVHVDQADVQALLQDLDGVGAAQRLDRLEPGLLDHVDRIEPEDRLVLDHQHRPSLRRLRLSHAVDALRLLNLEQRGGRRHVRPSGSYRMSSTCRVAARGLRSSRSASRGAGVLAWHRLHAWSPDHPFQPRNPAS